MVDGSHPIGFGLCLLPWAHAAVYEAIVAAGDGLLDGPIGFEATFVCEIESCLREGG